MISKVNRKMMDDLLVRAEEIFREPMALRTGDVEAAVGMPIAVAVVIAKRFLGVRGYTKSEGLPIIRKAANYLLDHEEKYG